MKRILLQGVGGVGGWLAAELLRAGIDVCLVTGNPAISEAINERGISLTTPDDAFTVEAEAWTSLDDVPAAWEFDCALLAMMAGGVVDAATLACTRLTGNGYCVAFQNGFVEDAIAAAIGSERVVSATVALGSTMEAPGIYRRTTQGNLIIGELDGSETPRIRELQDILANVIETEVSTNIVGVLWGKLVWNGSVSGLCAVSGKMLGELFDCAPGRELFVRGFREAVETAHADGVTIEPVIVPPAVYYEPAHASQTAHDRLLASLAPFVAKYTGVTPSTLESLKRGRKCEIDFLNGFILRHAHRLGVAAPLNERLVPMVHEIEAGTRDMGPHNLEELLAAIS